MPSMNARLDDIDVDDLEDAGRFPSLFHQRDVARQWCASYSDPGRRESFRPGCPMVLALASDRLCVCFYPLYKLML